MLLFVIRLMNNNMNLFKQCFWVQVIEINSKYLKLIRIKSIRFEMFWVFKGTFTANENQFSLRHFEKESELLAENDEVGGDFLNRFSLYRRSFSSWKFRWKKKKFELILNWILCENVTFDNFSRSRTGILSRLKKPFQKQPQPEVVERLVVVEQPQPCKAPQCQPKPPPDYVDERPCRSKKCKPKPVYDDGPCRSNRCQTCRNECNGDERCHSECIIVDKCW